MNAALKMLHLFWLTFAFVFSLLFASNSLGEEIRQETSVGKTDAAEKARQEPLADNLGSARNSALENEKAKTAATCFNDGRRLERRAAATEDPQLFADALEKYLCAAQHGHPEGSYRAALLADSKQAPPLPDDEIDALATFAAEKGVVGAQAFLGYWLCFEVGDDCKDLERAVFWLRKATENGSDTAANALGWYYEHGSLGKPDLERALACYNYASAKGYETAKRNSARVANLLHKQLASVKCQ